MEALYKMKKPKTGQTDRGVRARIKDTASKKSRANLLDSKRRIPLSEVQPSSNNNVPEKEEKPTKSRFEQLQEWKKQREEAKLRDKKDTKKPPFRPCGRRTVQVTVRKSPVSKPLPASKRTTAVVTSRSSPNVTCAKKATSCKTAAPARSSARLAAKHQAVPSTARDTTKSRELSSRPKSASKPKSTKPPTKPPTTTAAASKPATSTVASKKPDASTKPPVVKGKKTTAQVKNNNASKKVPPAKTQKTVNVSEKRTTRGSASKTASTTKQISKGKTTKGKASTRKTKEIPMEMDEDESIPDEPPTPTKRSYVPVHPSPLLKRQIAPVRRETVFMPQFVNDPAWIPGAVPDLDNLPAALNFDDAFDNASFSPFRFTAAQSSAVYSSPELQPEQPQFVFQPPTLPNRDDITTDETASSSAGKKTRRSAQKRRRNSRRCSTRLEIPIALVVDCGDGKESSDDKEVSVNQESTPTSGDDGDVDTPSSSRDTDLVCTEQEDRPPATKRRRSSRRHSRRSLVVAPMSTDSESGTNTSTEGSQEELTNGDEKGIDFGYFNGLYTEVTEDFTKLCHEWDDKSNKLEEEYSSDQSGSEDINVEDVLGQIRTTVGQAQLLMRKKLKQYLHLVEEAQDPMVEKRANADDLQSFWDMVYFQVEDVQKKFDAIRRLEKNGWKEKAPTPAKKKTKKRKATASKAGPSASAAESNERLQAARDKRAAQRNRLKEMKLAAKRAREQEATEAVDEPQVTQEQEEPPIVSPALKRMKTVHTPESGSARKERRRSQRLVSRSVFSPIASVKSNTCLSEVPTGCLVSFSPMK